MMHFMNAMHSIAKVTGRDVATAFDLSRYRTACDVGGSCVLNTYYKKYSYRDKKCVGAFLLVRRHSHTQDMVLAFVVFLCLILTGCTGAMAYEFTKAHPELSVTVFDLPPVIEMRSRFQPEEQDSRVSFVAG